MVVSWALRFRVLRSLCLVLGWISFCKLGVLIRKALLLGSVLGPRFLETPILSGTPIPRKRVVFRLPRQGPAQKRNAQACGLHALPPFKRYPG